MTKPTHAQQRSAPQPDRQISWLSIWATVGICAALLGIDYAAMSNLPVLGWDKLAWGAAAAGALAGLLQQLLDHNKLAMNEHGMRSIDRSGALYCMLRCTFSFTAGLAASLVATQALSAPKNENDIIIAAIAFAGAYAQDLTAKLGK